MSTRLKRLLHIKTDREELDTGLQRRASRRAVRSSASIPTSPYSNASPGSPPRTGETPIHGSANDTLREDSIASQQSDQSHRFKRMSFFERTDPPPRSPYSASSATSPQHLLSAIQLGPDLAQELKHLTIPDDQLAKKYRESAATRKYIDPKPYKPNRHARFANIPFFQNQQHYAELVASRKVHLSQHPALRSRARTGPDRDEPKHNLDAAPPVPERDQSRPRYQATDFGVAFLKDRAQKASSVSSSSDGKSLSSSASEPAIQPAPLNKRKDTIFVPREKSSDSPSSSEGNPRTDYFASYIPLNSQTDASEQKYLSKDTSSKLALDKQIDLSSSEDLSVDERIAPAVVHETIVPDVHHIRFEQTTREIHHHHVHNRILPIIDVQVLSARHFVPASELQALGAKPLRSDITPPDPDTSYTNTFNPPSIPPQQQSLLYMNLVFIADNDKNPEAAVANASTLIEVDPRSLPAHATSPGGLPRNPGDIDSSNPSRMVETRSQMLPSPLSPLPVAAPQPRKAPPQFIARSFKVTEGDSHEGVEDDGVPRSEHWWNHPPAVLPSVVLGLHDVTARPGNGGGGEEDTTPSTNASTPRPMPGEFVTTP